jgi:Xaa-Pro aminopeptidase
MSRAFTAGITASFVNRLKKEGLDGFIASSTDDMRYFTGYPFTLDGEAVLLLSPKGNYCFAKTLLFNDISSAAPHFKAVDINGGNYYEAALEYAGKLNLKKVGFDPDKVSFTDGKTLSKKCLPAGGLTAAARLNKTPEEMDLIKKACAITAKTYKMIKAKMKTGMTEGEVAGIMEAYMKKLGADALAFPTIVAFGAASAVPHHRASCVNKLKKEDAVLIDFGCSYNGYASDMTRSWWHGNKAPAEYVKIWALVAKAKAYAFKNARSGMKGKEIDALCRGMIEKGGYGDKFIHAAGHSLGLYIHERPTASKVSEDIVTESTPLAIEPGVYLPGKYGVRLEDTVILTKSGVKILTK